MGAVSSTLEVASRRVPGRAPSRARAYARCAARSPMFDPRATYVRAVVRLCHVGEAARQIAQHGRHLLEVAGRPFEVRQPLGGLHRARRDVIGLEPVLSRDAGHRVDALAQARERLILFSRRRGDPAGVRGRLGRRGDDRVERLERGRGELLDIAHVHLPAPHLLDDLADLRVNVLHQVARLRRRGGALLGESPHLVRDDAEALAVLPGPRRLDCRVQCQQVCHIGDLTDRRDEAGDAPAHLTELLDFGRAFAHEQFERDEPLDRFANLGAVAARDVTGRRGRTGRAGAIVRDAARHLRQALRGLQTPRHLALFAPHPLADHARRGGNGGRRLFQRFRRLGDRRELARHALDRLDERPPQVGDMHGGSELAGERRDRQDILTITTFASQLATAVHITDLRRPLVETVERMTRQLATIAQTAEALKQAASAVAASTGVIREGVRREEGEVSGGLEATESLAQVSRRVSDDGAGAARASAAASDVASRNRTQIREAIQRLVALKLFVGESSTKVQQLGQMSRRITGFIASIREIADMTNLLALNAAIEAARAGKHGKGFGVVADEVRTLAEQSATAAAEAGDLVQDIHTQVGEVVEQMRRGQVNVGDVEELSAAALEALDAIVAATAEATAHAGRITAAAGEQNQAFARLRERINAVASIAGQNRLEADDVATRAVQAAEGLTDLERATRDLEQVATMLRDLTRGFANVA